MVELQVENPKGCTGNEYAGNSSKLVSCTSSHSADFGESMSAVEVSAEKVLNFVHPTLDSEEKRGDVIHYIQHLVKDRIGCEVVSYGSVPLKTYLPEGDIDLTALKGPNVEEALIHDIFAVIQEEERNENAEFEVTETQFIDAEVKLVKCLVGNIVIDISCNQLGGLSTLCFLEQVDRFIGRNHLFKRSVILIKTWCYYESRILGAHHGLISTYALETLVLYIFHFFHPSLSGPLSVLHKFLDYYSQFDWENYCVSLKGPIHISSLPDIMVDMPQNFSNTQLLTEEFLKSCTEMFSTACRKLEDTSKVFQIKHLNIMDPLKENNNLGRSVNRANFYRIRNALKYGSSKLRLILSKSREDVDEIRSFFANTCERHGNRNRRIMKSLVVDVDDEESLTACISSPAVLSSDDELVKSYSCDLDDDSCFWEQEPASCFLGDDEKCALRDSSAEAVSCSGAEELSISRYYMVGKSSIGTSYSSSWGGAADDLSSGKYSLIPSENRCYETTCSVENASIEFDQSDSTSGSEKFHFTSWLENGHAFLESRNPCGLREEHSEVTHTTSPRSFTKLLDNVDCREFDSISIDEESEVLDALADLKGDYDSHIRSLLRGQLWNGSSSLPITTNTSSFPPFHGRFMRQWDIVCRSMPLYRMNSHRKALGSSMNADGFDYVSSCSRSDNQFEGNKRVQGIGTYFPKPGLQNDACVENRPSGRGRNKALSYHRNSLHPAYSASSASSENIQLKVQPARVRLQVQKQNINVHCQSPSSVTFVNETKGCSVESCRIQFGSLGEIPGEMFSNSSLCRSQGPPEKESLKQESIRLSEEDFPPLRNNCISKPCLPCIR